MDRKTVTARLQREKGLRLRVDFPGTDLASFTVDEPPPLGESAGPDATRLVAAAVGTCLSQSLLFCLQRSRTGVEDLATRVTATVERNESGRLRIAGIAVVLEPVLEKDGETGPDEARLERCLGLFQDFCTVAESLRGGVPIEVTVAEPVLGR